MVFQHIDEKTGKAMFRGLPCPYCHTIAYLWAKPEDIEEFLNGSNKGLDKIFPYFTLGEREALITGICDSCWTKIFGKRE